MKKEYLKPTAEYISLAAAEQIATGADYYAEGGMGGPSMSGGIVDNPFA